MTEAPATSTPYTTLAHCAACRDDPHLWVGQHNSPNPYDTKNGHATRCTHKKCQKNSKMSAPSAVPRAGGLSQDEKMWQHPFPYTMRCARTPRLQKNLDVLGRCRQQCFAGPGQGLRALVFAEARRKSFSLRACSSERWGRGSFS